MNKQPVYFISGMGITLVLVWLFYHPVLGFDIYWDDERIRLTRNFYTRDDFFANTFLHSIGLGNFYRPLPLLLMAIESRFFGVAGVAKIAHLINLLLMMANVLMVGYLARECLSLKTRFASVLAVMAALLFAFHPALMSCFAFVTTRFDIMMTFFLLMALVVEFNCLASPPKNLMMVLLIFLALCSKESAAAAIPVLILLGMERDAAWRADADKGFFRASVQYVRAHAERLFFYMVPLAFYAGLRLAAKVYLPVDVQDYPVHGVNFFLKVLDAVGQLIQLELLPQTMVQPAFQPMLPWSLLNTPVLVGIVALLLAGVLFGMAGKSGKAFILVFVMLLFPYMNILISPAQNSLFWPWYLLFPTAILVGCILPRLVLFFCAFKKPFYQWAMLLGISVWFGSGIYLIHQNLYHWKSGADFFAWWMTKHPDSSFGAENYEIYLMRSGDYERAYNSAMALVTKYPQSPGLYSMAAQSALRLNKLASANDNIHKAMQTKEYEDEYAVYLSIAAEVQMRLGNLDAAQTLLEQSRRIAPGDMYLLLETTNYCVMTGDVRCAEENFTLFNGALTDNAGVRALKLLTYARDEASIDELKRKISALQAKRR